MKLVLSPAKSLDFNSQLPTDRFTEAYFLNEAETLNGLLKKKSAKNLSKLMRISDALGRLNYERNQEWSLPFSQANARPAVYAFSGDVYRGLDVYNLPKSKIEFMQNTVRILSGLYGLLKPLDLIQPYRLEMGTKMAVGRKKNLYGFWSKTITEKLNAELDDAELFVNLASTEYFKAIDTKLLKVPVITPVFKDMKNGEYKVIMTYAKLARGYMTRYILDTKAKTLDDLKGFDYEGYHFSEPQSSENELVFVR
ncbi:MAG TPA: peroxide stress protein YaaA [Flavobacteriaceae bacterium]|nr:peroxide stress protein YaaA [Flavobacteriaceae bacterium]MCB9214172.1 peroxide stress protein YaaA [Alteromonas sp.]HPF12558.1 peroxide stress protein YaaA [Flavobacteriaceae bacterium]HQU22460.1 peroxide stress protein YaaA [Flavobacteriaceae bacterium]HQU66419.1 peroxide stress protein YaaA [Flavobacteriaceae bacterium]